MCVGATGDSWHGDWRLSACSRYAHRVLVQIVVQIVVQTLVGQKHYTKKLCVTGYLIDRGNVPLGFQLATGASVALGAAMTTRYVKTKKLLPSGVLAVLGTVSAAYYAVAAVEFKPT